MNRTRNWSQRGLGLFSHQPQEQDETEQRAREQRRNRQADIDEWTKALQNRDYICPPHLAPPLSAMLARQPEAPQWRPRCVVRWWERPPEVLGWAATMQPLESGAYVL